MSGHPLRFTKGNKFKNIPPKPVLPTPGDVAILRRTAIGFIIVTLRESNHDNGKRHFAKLVAEKWLIGDKGDSLFPEDPQPQIYRARKL